MLTIIHNFMLMAAKERQRQRHQAFKDRFDAGKQLAIRLQHYKGQDGLVVAVPRGGVETGYAVARELGLPLEVVLSKKMAHPVQKEFAIGAVSLEGTLIRRGYGVPKTYIKAETERIRALLRGRYQLYYKGREPESLKGHIVIIVDDGIATGSTLLSTIELIRKSQPSRIVLAVPVSAPEAARMLESVADELACLLEPEDFYAVGQFYEEFRQVSDEEVAYWLETAHREKQGPVLQ